MRVRITATREQLEEMGVISETTFEALLSGRTFRVVERRPVPSGNVLVYLAGEPFLEGHMIWVYEQYTKLVQ